MDMDNNLLLNAVTELLDVIVQNGLLFGLMGSSISLLLGYVIASLLKTFIKIAK